MSEKTQNKFLYLFEMNRDIEIEKTEEQVINGETVKVTKKVKEPQTIKLALKRPNRKMYEDADLNYGIWLSNGIRAGLLTKPLLLKKYENNNSPLGDVDRVYFQELAREFQSVENEHQKLLININEFKKDELDAKIKDVTDRKIKIIEQLQGLEDVNRVLFAHTAESKADIKLINWWILNLSYWEKDGEYKEFFEGETFEEKSDYWDKLRDEEDEFMLSASNRFNLLVNIWNRGAKTQKEFEDAEKEFKVISE